MQNYTAQSRKRRFTMASNSLRETVRKDGLRIITKKLPYTKRVRVAVEVGVGSAYDPSGYEGLAHFLEHMAFAGTKFQQSADINMAVSQYLLDFGAYTAELGITYFGEAVYTRFRELCEILFDVYLYPIFPGDKIEKEKEIIRNEIAKHKNNDRHNAHFALCNLLWRKNPHMRFSAGTPESVERINRDVLVGIFTERYVPSNTVIIGTGKIEHEALVEKVNETFALNSAKVSHNKWDDESGEPPAKKKIIIEKPGREIAVVNYGCKIPALNEREKNALFLLNCMFHFMLETEIRNKRGFAYSTESALFGNCQLGDYFLFLAEVLRPRINETADLIYDTVCNYPLQKKIFEIYKTSFDNFLLVSTESPQDWHELIADIIIEEGRDLSYLKSYLQRRRKILSKMTFEEVVELRRKIIRPEHLACAIIKPS
ncbi:insulinase family protein [Candidatus Parcubacteria bacterium]|nr:insulinase family protein [Candidatus Parcubacteria bacterium]